MDIKLNGIQELPMDLLIDIYGGSMSMESFLIGCGLTILCPVAGVGYWVGYACNS